MIPKITSVFALLLVAATAHAQSVQKRTLPNGLTVLVQENRAAPVVAVRFYVKTGSIYENQFLGSGISHLFEHTLFEGTKTRDKKALNDEIQAIGGQSNAYTSYDVTAYHITTAAPYFERALGVMADMTQNSTFPEAEVKVQQGVIHNEMNLGADDPDRALSELFTSTAFRVHPVRYSIIGFRSQFDKLTRDDILSYYKSHYTPENSILSVAGDVSAASAFALAEKQFGNWERVAPIALALPKEPIQTSPRRAVIEKDVNLTYLQMGWHTIPLQHPDLYALDTLAQILGGGDSSRLTRELQERQNLVSGISAYSSTPNYDAGVFAIRATLPPANVSKVERGIVAQVERIKREGVSESELVRAKRQIRSSFIFGKQGVENQAESNAYDEMGTGDPTYSARYVNRISAVTAAQIQAVARKYLLQDGLTTAIVKPRTKTAAPVATTASVAPDLASQDEKIALLNRFLDNIKAENGGKAPASLAELAKLGKFDLTLLLSQNALVYDAQNGTVSRAATPQTPPSGADTQPIAAPANRPVYAARVRKLPNGVTLILRPNKAAPTVSIVAMGLGGVRLENEKQGGISSLAAQMLTRGTQKRSEEQIAQLVADLGGSLNGFAGYNAWGIESSWLSSDWKRGINLVAESILAPTFPTTELAKVKSQTLDALGAQEDDPMSSASILLRKTFYGDHPYGRNQLGTPQSVKAINRAQIAAYWNRVLQPKNLILSIAGDFDVNAMEKTARALFGTFRSKGTLPPAPPAVTPPPTFSLGQKNKPGIAQSVLWFGFPSVDIRNEDRFALDVLDAAMSGADLPGGRLHARLRDNQLVYVVHAYATPGIDGGMFVIYAASSKENRAQVRSIIEEEVARVRAEGISAEELERAKTMMISARAIDLQTNAAQARDLASNQLFGLGTNSSSNYAAKINAVTLEDVKRVAEQYLKLDNAALALVEN
ncbi:MAG TPA: pitrilysin family protein [Abditibacterium sp.]|jgi:zinc protease